MESNAKVLCSDLPHEVIESVLSFLPVPSLCRFRAVCKGWNELTRKPAFHDLCDLNGAHKHRRYLFVTRYSMHGDRHRLYCLRFVDALRRPLSILDLEMNRWYTIPTHIYSRGASGEELGSRLLAMDDGLICELTGKYNPWLVIADPVAASTKELPRIPAYGPAHEQPHLVVATAVDPISSTYKIAVLYIFYQFLQYNRACVYESSTNAWREIKPQHLIAESVVFFPDVLYAIYPTCRGSHTFRLKTLTLNRQSDNWSVIPISMPRHPHHPRLIVTGGRLYMTQWIPTAAQLRGLTRSRLRTPDESFDFARSNSVLEIVEIVVESDHHSTRSLVQMTSAQLREWFGEESLQIAYAVPVVDDSSGVCQSVCPMCRARWCGATW